MGRRQRTVYLFIAMILALAVPALAQHGHMEGPGKGMDMPGKQTGKTSPLPALKPAQGASVQILSPKEGQSFKGDEIPLQFKMVKGKVGNHVHAYVDGELMGMFESEKGTLTGIKPGRHTLELRVVSKDHQTELNATDKVRFVAQ
jgi:hypothetical protein